MKKIVTGFCVLLLVGCAQQKSIQEPGKQPEVGKEVEVPVVEPSIPEVKPEVKPEIKPLPEVKPVSEKKPKPVPVVTKTKDGKLILGAQEWVWFDEVQTHVKVKINTNSKVSTIGTSDVENFERDGKSWVKFTSGGKSIERPVVRWTKSNGDDNKQAVVKLRTKLGELNEQTEFILIKGSGVTLGENFTRDVAVRDAKRNYVQPKVK
ncbi:RimK/LysX family protein [Photobacterium profundum]|uniref:putative ATP-dependent zinc protease n=1 Tax=Photobacterium profundum TaxID=74109 RepID=UPI003D0A210C